MDIWGFLVNGLKLLCYIFDPNKKARAERKKIWREFKDIEEQYRVALAEGKPQLAAQLGKKMKDMRDEYDFISVYEYGTKKDGK